MKYAVVRFFLQLLIYNKSTPYQPFPLEGDMLLKFFWLCFRPDQLWLLDESTLVIKLGASDIVVISALITPEIMLK